MPEILGLLTQRSPIPLGGFPFSRPVFSPRHSQMIMAATGDDLLLKKMLYLYISTYAQQKQAGILCIDVRSCEIEIVPSGFPFPPHTGSGSAHDQHPDKGLHVG